MIHDVDVNVKDVRGDTALHLAVREGSINITELLIKERADISAVNKVCTHSNYTQHFVLCQYIISKDQYTNRKDVLYSLQGHLTYMEMQGFKLHCEITCSGFHQYI